jgi:hypothetical protein
MDFAAPLISLDLTLVEADPFQLMLRAGNKTVSYTGPQNAVLSKNSECVYAVNIKQPVRFNHILAPTGGCLPKEDSRNDTLHFAVDSCVRTTKFDEHNFIQIKPYDKEYQLYCPGSIITVEGIQRPCPNHVFSLPMSTNFSINELRFTGSRISLAHQETLDPLFTVKTNWHLQPSINWTSLMIDTSHDEFHELHMPMVYHITSNYWSTFGCIIFICVLVMIIVCMCARRKKHPKAISVFARPIEMAPMSKMIEMSPS